MKVADYPDLRADTRSVAEEARKENVYLDFARFKVPMTEDEFLQY